MKIIVVGGSGTIGKAVVAQLQARHEVIVVGRSQSNIQVDITSVESIKKMFEQIGSFDALISTTGKVKFLDFAQMNDSDYRMGLDNKLMGQVNLVLIGKNYISDRGSFTLTSGILNIDPIRYGTSAAMVNAALEGFVRAAAIEMPRGIRINVVSPTVIEESMKEFADYFRGYLPVPAKIAALAFSKSVEGLQTGQVYRVGY